MDARSLMYDFAEFSGEHEEYCKLNGSCYARFATKNKRWTELFIIDGL